MNGHDGVGRALSLLDRRMNLPVVDANKTRL